VPTEEGLTVETPLPAPPAPAQRRSRRRLVIALVSVLTVVGLLATAGGVWLVRLQRSYDRNIQRFGDPSRTIPTASRPTAAAPGALNLLLLGSDSRVSAGEPSQWSLGAQRTDAIMLLHIPADRSGAFVASIPRDSWVRIPGHGYGKINAAFSYGGPALMVRTVETLTDVRIDHVVIVDFTGFSKLTDTLGGVTISVPRATRDKRAEFPAGTYRMDGATALNYVRQRYNLPGGDFDRERRQQNWIRAVLRGVASEGTLTDPVRLNHLITELTKSIAADDSFTISQMRDLAWSLRGLPPSQVAFFTAPIAGTGRSPDGRQSIVNLDPVADRALWTSMAHDQVLGWVADHTPALLASTVD